MEAEIKEILKKIRLIRENNNLSQETIADKMNITQSSYARFERGATKTDLESLLKFCKGVNMSFLDFVAYPDKVSKEKEKIKATLQIELEQDKKEQVLKLVFGENNLEILNR